MGMREPRGREHLENKRFNRLLRDGHRLQADVVNTVMHGRRVFITGAVKNIPLHIFAFKRRALRVVFQAAQFRPWESFGADADFAFMGLEKITGGRAGVPADFNFSPV